MSRRARYTVEIEREGEGVAVNVVTPDGELQHVGVVSEPHQLPAFMGNFSAYLALLVVNTVWEVRTS